MILEPSSRRRVGQNTIIIRGVPLPAKNKKGAESTVKTEPTIATLFLNQRLSKRISKTPRIKPKIILGNLIA